MTIRAAIYIRTSPDCHLSEVEQIAVLTTLADEREWTVERVFTDRPTSVKAGQDRRPAESALIHAIRSGEINKVLTWSVCRIGKSLTEFVAFLQTCQTFGAAVYLHQQRTDTETSNCTSLFDVAAMLALHLRQSRRDRILRGQAAARALDIRFGRPPLGRVKVEKAKREIAAGIGVRAVARLTGISAASACRIKHSMERAAVVI